MMKFFSKSLTLWGYHTATQILNPGLHSNLGIKKVTLAFCFDNTNSTSFYLNGHFPFFSSLWNVIFVIIYVCKKIVFLGDYKAITQSVLKQHKLRMHEGTIPDKVLPRHVCDICVGVKYWKQMCQFDRKITILPL